MGNAVNSMGETPAEQGEGGRFQETYSDEYILSLFGDYPHGVATSSDIAEALDYSGAGARRRLRKLHTAGELARRETPGGTVLWWMRGEEGDSDE